MKGGVEAASVMALREKKAVVADLEADANVVERLVGGECASGPHGLALDDRNWREPGEPQLCLVAAPRQHYSLPAAGRPER